MPANIFGRWHANGMARMRRPRAAGLSRYRINCVTAANSGSCANRSGYCLKPPMMAGAGRRAVSSTIANVCITSAWPTKAHPSVRERSNRRAPNSKAGSKGRVSSGACRAKTAFWHWTWPAAMATGTRTSGIKRRSSAQTHPLAPFDDILLARSGGLDHLIAGAVGLTCEQFLPSL
jgi:hypothetical protein